MPGGSRLRWNWPLRMNGPAGHSGENVCQRAVLRQYFIRIDGSETNPEPGPIEFLPWGVLAADSGM